MFHPEAFLKQFKLCHEHLAILGSILGNDVVPFAETIAGFSQIAKPKFSVVGDSSRVKKVRNNNRHSLIAGLLNWMASQKPELALDRVRKRLCLCTNLLDSSSTSSRSRGSL
jgi:hypothetical protein